MKDNLIPLRRRKKKADKRLLFVLAIIVGALCFILYLILINVKITGIVVSGNIKYTDDEIIRMVGADVSPHVLDLYFKTQELEARQEKNYPFIDKVTIYYESYNKIRIEVIEKKTVAHFYYLGQYLCLDKNGIVIDYAKEREALVPLVKGITIQEFVLGQPMSLKTGIVEGVLRLYQLQERYSLVIDSIEFQYNDVHNVNIYVEGLVIRLGTLSELDKKLEKLSQILLKIDAGTQGYLNLEDPSQTPILKKIQSSQ